MAADTPEPHVDSENAVEIPQIAIAQAEAVVSANQEQPPGPSHSSTVDASGGAEVHDVPGVPSTDPSQIHDNAHRPGVEEQPIEQVPQVAYGPQLGQVDLSQDGFNTRAKVAGRTALGKNFRT